MKAYFDFETRMGLQVATAAAEEVETNRKWGRNFLEEGRKTTRPVLLSIKNSTFRFEGGIVVKVFQKDIGDKMQEFVVEKVSVKYFLLDPAGYPVGEKISEEWGPEKLRALKEFRPWWHPHVIFTPPQQTEEFPFDPIPPACLLPDLETIKKLVSQPGFKGWVGYYHISGGSHSGSRPWISYSCEGSGITVGKHPLEFDYEFLEPWISKWGIENRCSDDGLTIIRREQIQKRKELARAVIKSFASANEWAARICRQDEEE